MALAAKRPPADLEGAETLLLELQQCFAQWSRRLHQQRGIRPHALAIPTAKQAPDRLPGCLAQNIPEGDIDPADRVRDRAAAPEPEGMLVELFAHPLGLERR